MSVQEMSPFASTILNQKYAHTKNNGNKETWLEVAERVSHSVTKAYLPSITDKITTFIAQRKFIPGGRYLYSSGRRYPQVNNCFLFAAEDSREGWADTMHDCTSSLMTGGGIGVVYSKLRAEDSIIGGMGGKSTGPIALMNMVNESARYIMQGGSRRSAVWAGLHWNHSDIHKFICLKDWPQHIREWKAKDIHSSAPMDGTNISVILDDHFFQAYHNFEHKDHELAQTVYWNAVRHMLETGEPGFSVDIGENEGESLRNACTEVTSRDSGDMCNLGSVNLARIETIDELTEVMQVGIAFLLCGTIYSKLPIPGMYQTREKNRRLGLGLMGIHEWLLKRGYRYEMVDELREWLEVYQLSTAIANRYADQLSISRPIATRSIAPTGTISIVAETTSGLEPIFTVAYKRRYLKGREWVYQYVVDATAKRLIDNGVDPKNIEDAYTLAEDYERRIKMQAELQRYVDHGISSTINLPAWNTVNNNEHTVKEFGNKLMQYLPEVRGITAYPDGSRGGQPLSTVSYEEAMQNIGREYKEEETGNMSCVGGFCNS